MTTQQRQNMIRATPFQPFWIHLADGREVHVPHPEMIAHAPTGRIAVVTHADDSFEVIDRLLVVRLKRTPPLSAPSPAGEQQG